MTGSARYLETGRVMAHEAALYHEALPQGLPQLTPAAFLTGISRAFDLAEGRAPGHAQRVAYIAVSLAEELGLDAQRTEDVFFASLLHDAGMAAARPARDRSRSAHQPDGDNADLPDAHGLMADGDEHARAGARVARQMGLRETVARAVNGHHGLTCSASKATLATKIVAAAVGLESLIDSEGSPLRVRRQVIGVATSFDKTGMEARTSEAASRLLARDTFWLGLYDNDLAAWLSAHGGAQPMDGAELLAACGVMSDLVDTRAGRTRGRGRRVAGLAARIATVAGLSAQRASLVRLAALLQDLGTLGIPVEHLSKPDILTVDEMATMQLHPIYARDILSELPGFGMVAWWVGCHHERVDGKGYPAMLEGEEVPVEAQVIGMAEAYEALTSDRPYRQALAHDEALAVVRGMAGQRFDEGLYATLVDALHGRASDASLTGPYPGRRT